MYLQFYDIAILVTLKGPLRVQRKRNPLTLLVGMQTSTATVENSVEIS